MSGNNTKKTSSQKHPQSQWEEYLKPFEDLKIEIKNIYYPELEYEKNLFSKTKDKENKIESVHTEKPSNPVEIPLTMAASLQEMKEYFKPFDPLGILPSQEENEEISSGINKKFNELEKKIDKPSQKVILTFSEENEGSEDSNPVKKDPFLNLKSLTPKELGMPSINKLKNEFENSLKNVFKDNNFLEATYESLNMTEETLGAIEDVENILKTTHTPIDRYLEVYKRKINSFFTLNDRDFLPSLPTVEGITGIILGKNKHGMKTSSLAYEHGKLNGISSTYNTDGSIKEQMTYENGQLDGLYETYDSQGNLISSLTFKDGKLNGPGTFYNEGRKYAEFEFVDGIQQGSSNTYYESGSVMTSCTYSSGKMEGEYKVINDQGDISSIIAYKEGLKNGKSTSYYTTGEILETGTYTTDLKDGTFISYYQNGNPNQISQYQNGRLIDLPIRYSIKGREIDA